MSAEDALVADMHRLLEFLQAAPPVADQATVERLLAARLGPSDVPPGFEGVARLLAAATAPAAAEELAGEPQVLAEFAAVVPSHPPTLVPRRATMPSKVLRVKAAAVVGRIRRRCGRWRWRPVGPTTSPPTAATSRPPASRAPPPDRMPAVRPVRGCAGPGRPARVPTTAVGRSRWRSGRWPPRPAGLTRSPPSAKPPPPAALAPMPLVRRPPASQRRRPRFRRQTAARPQTRAREGRGRADHQPPPASYPADWFVAATR